jgi:type I site-specific restriction endonuclease
MTKRLEELFGLDDQDDDLQSVLPTQEENYDLSPTISQETLKTIEKVESALPTVKGLEATDREMDDFSDLAKEAFNNLMDLGLQVDARFSAEIFNSASSMLGHAISAKTAKVNKKLKMIDLQLKKAELDRKLAVQSAKTDPADDTESANLGIGMVVDRNELIRQVLAQVEDNKNIKKDK